MPVDRMIHPRLGHSDKVSLLTDLEFRVWVQYILSADDFGVMRRSAVTLQADNDHLSNRPKRKVDRCVDTLVKCGLLLAFEHQRRGYVCQWDWQDWQHVGYPRTTIQPIPPPEILQKCSTKTLALFDRHPLNPQPTLAKDSANISEIVSESSTPSRARETAKANANGFKDKKDVPKISAGSKRPIYQSDRFVVFEWQLDDLGRMLGKHLDDFDLHAFFDSLSQQSRQSGLVIPRANVWDWLQAQVLTEAKRRGLPIAGVTTAERPRGCQHLPPCVDEATHTARYLREQAAAS